MLPSKKKRGRRWKPRQTKIVQFGSLVFLRYFEGRTPTLLTFDHFRRLYSTAEARDSRQTLRCRSRSRSKQCRKSTPGTRCMKFGDSMTQKPGPRRPEIPALCGPSLRNPNPNISREFWKFASCFKQLHLSCKHHRVIWNDLHLTWHLQSVPPPESRWQDAFSSPTAALANCRPRKWPSSQRSARLSPRALLLKDVSNLWISTSTTLEFTKTSWLSPWQKPEEALRVAPKR